ncbi:conserved membrane family protein [Mycobacterium xenopi 3993]|nr:conserved membrane family protein [Mycobacterium xenopi 3993]
MEHHYDQSTVITAAPKHTPVGAPLLFGITIAFAAAAAVGGAPVGAAVADRPLLPPSSETIRYQVNGSPGVAAYLNYAIDYTQQYQTNVPLPWTKEFTVPPGQVYVLSAQSSGTGSITCTISIDGKVVSNMTSTGTPARAACSH